MKQLLNMATAQNVYNVCLFIYLQLHVLAYNKYKVCNTNIGTELY